ncbi:hypothetical protein [Gloeothece verrucosa]|uniref:Uncharacterized protein n=1 Tax=Gloeothece verrucosa (strain PCC 7822) TaxID=497965 RepID=E0UF30_GLOV7|nr:hypothetical protein [Gloeothece verrucosa]ADN14282.1 hypothetical protein Cyan7822_2304 [Gloeothece verrucosa PCC 7822]
MERWQFLIQKEGDRLWTPINQSTPPLVEGRYRIVAHGSKPNFAVEIRITHQSEDGHRSRIESCSRRTNAQGLMMILPFTYLEAGIWELRCSCDVLSELLGRGWQKQIQLQVAAKVKQPQIPPVNWPPTHQASSLINPKTQTEPEFEQITHQDQATYYLQKLEQLLRQKIEPVLFSSETQVIPPATTNPTHVSLDFPTSLLAGGASLTPMDENYLNLCQQETEPTNRLLTSPSTSVLENKENLTPSTSVLENEENLSPSINIIPSTSVLESEENITPSTPVLENEENLTPSININFSTSVLESEENITPSTPVLENEENLTPSININFSTSVLESEENLNPSTPVLENEENLSPSINIIPSTYVLESEENLNPSTPVLENEEKLTFSINISSSTSELETEERHTPSFFREEKLMKEEVTWSDAHCIEQEGIVKLILNQDQFSRSEGEPILISGTVEAAKLEDKTLSIFQGNLRYELLDPETEQVIVYFEESVVEETFPFIFSYALEIPPEWENKFLIAEVILETETGIELDRQAVTIMTDVVDTIANPVNYTITLSDTKDKYSFAFDLLLDEEILSSPLNIDLPQPSKMERFNKSCQPSQGQILPPKITRTLDSSKAKIPQLPQIYKPRPNSTELVQVEEVKKDSQISVPVEPDVQSLEVKERFMERLSSLAGKVK